MRNYCVNFRFAKIFPVFYICWIVLYYVLIKWDGIDKNHFAALHTYNNTELAELLFYLTNNVLVSISVLVLLSISNTFNKDIKRIVVIFAITFILFPLIKVYSLIIPAPLPLDLMILEIPITIGPLIVILNIAYLGLLIYYLCNKQQRLFRFYGCFLGICIIYNYIHNYVIDEYSFDIPFKDFSFRLILFLIPFVLYLILISLNGYILIRTNNSLANYVPEENEELPNRKLKVKNHITDIADIVTGSINKTYS